MGCFSRKSCWASLLVLLIAIDSVGVVALEKVCRVDKTLTFLQVVPLTGIYALPGKQYYDGVRAAFEEYNNNPSLGVNVHLDLVVKDDRYDPFQAQSLVETTLDTTDIFAIVGVYSTKSALLSYPSAVDRKVPFVGARTGLMDLRQEYKRYVVNFRVSFFDEAAAIVEYMLARSFRRIAVFWQDDEVGQASLDGIVAALNSSNLEVCAQGKHTKLANDVLLDHEITRFLKSLVDTSITPDAIVVATVDRPAASFILRARTLWPHVFVGGMSSANPDLLVETLYNDGGPEILQNMVFAQLTPMLTDDSIIVAKYHNALSLVSSELIPSSVGIEGYLVGRLVIAALERTNGNFTREAFLDGFYKTGFFDLDGVRCGPFLPSKADNGCNQCMHQVAYVKPLEDASLEYAVDEDKNFRFSTCGYIPREWKRVVLGQSCSYTGISGQTCRDFRNGIFAAFKEVNDGGGLRGSMKLQLVTNDDLDDDDNALQNNLEFLNNPEVFGLIGTSGRAIHRVVEEASSRGKPMFGPYSGVASIREPFQRSIINFRASQSDEISAIMSYCYYKIKVNKIAVLYENSTLGRAGRDEIENHIKEKRLTLHSEGSYDYYDPDLTEGIYSIFFGPQGLPEAVVIVGYADVLDEILLESHALDRDIYVFALSQTVTTELVNILASPEATEYLKVVDLRKLIITQCVPVATDLNIQAVANYTSALSRFDDMLSVSFAGLEGYFVGHLVATSVQRVMGDSVSTDKVVDVIYDSGSFNLFGTRCGPFEDSSNTSAGCNQCMRRTWLTRLSDDGMVYHVVDTFSFSTCMYKPSPNLDFQLHGMRLVMVILATAGNFYVVVFIALFLRHRNHEDVKHSIKFSLISLVGAICFFSAIYLLYFIPTDFTCALEPWVADVPFALLFGPLFSKTQRIDKLFNNKKMQRRRITDGQVLKNFVLLLLVFVVHLIIWAIVSPRQMVESWTLDGYRFESCKSPVKTFQYIAWVLKALMLLWGCFLCTRVYKITGQFARLNESKVMAVSIYNTTFSALIALVLNFTINDPNVYFASFASLLLINTFAVVTLLFARPLYCAVRGITIAITEETETTSKNSNAVVPMKSGSGKNFHTAASKSSTVMMPSGSLRMIRNSNRSLNKPSSGTSVNVMPNMSNLPRVNTGAGPKK